MATSRMQAASGYGWGSRGQLLACRVSHALGLAAVLGLLLVVTDAPIVVWLAQQLGW
jgi:hypothetical protein